ncbi:hypothetical protein C5167_024936 [Papaver somniferum]|uniref:Pentacotripeptide-repeat region of PRORP domain-containing protein n=1 Tax=Papaver somniferum TaxID=3469 RepID=A0A4Y7JSY7_PAPSO|nr:hypothetical protein C5167_024936 [Papaver somniferum]
MQSDGVLPDIFTYNKARQLLSEIPNKGLVADVVTYTSMINGLFKEGMIIEAEKLIIEMKDKGCMPNATTYDTIIKGYLLENDVARALELLKEMRKRKLSLTDGTKSLLISLLSP